MIKFLKDIQLLSPEGDRLPKECVAKAAASDVEDGKGVSALVCVFVLMLDVLGDHLVGNVARADGVVPSSPQVLAPELFSQALAFLEEFSGGFAFEVLGDFADRELGRDGQEEVNVVSGDMPA